MSTPEEKLLKAIFQKPMAVISDPTGDPPPVEMHRTEMGVALHQTLDIEGGPDILIITRTMAPALIEALQAWVRETH